MDGCAFPEDKRPVGFFYAVPILFPVQRPMAADDCHDLSKAELTAFLLDFLHVNGAALRFFAPAPDKAVNKNVLEAMVLCHLQEGE